MNKTKKEIVTKIVNLLTGYNPPKFFTDCETTEDQVRIINAVLYGFKLGLKHAIDIEDEPEELITEDKDLFLKVNGKHFRCNYDHMERFNKVGSPCLCNIFRKVVDEDRYVCNSCRTVYKAYD